MYILQLHANGKKQGGKKLPIKLNLRKFIEAISKMGNLELLKIFGNGK